MRNFLNRLFRRAPNKIAPIPSNAATAPLDEEQVWDLSEGRGSSKYGHLIAGSALDPGQRRDNNEDAVLCINASLGGADALPFGLFAIADGMGGPRNGELVKEKGESAIGAFLVGDVF